MFRFFLCLLVFSWSPVLSAEPLGDGLEPSKLKGGQFIWQGDKVSSGAVVAWVSIPKQRVYVYRNGVLIGVSSVSTGKQGYGTPVGLFTVLEKDRNHHSRTYDNAPMPFANRLTWEGVALHAGHVPNFPASHGCVRLPAQFARHLFGVSNIGMTVIIAGYQNAAFKHIHPSVLLPVDSLTNSANLPNLAPNEAFRWQPDYATEGAISVVINVADQHILVYRKGIEIGRAKLSMTSPQKNLGTHTFIMQQGESAQASSFLNHHWLAIGHTEHQGILNSAFNIPSDFAKSLDSVLVVGTTLLITDTPMPRQQATKVVVAPPPPHPRCVKGDCINGEGMQVYTDGSKYVGQFKNGLSEGQGVLIFANGEKYTGMFKEDKFQSQ